MYVQINTNTKTKPIKKIISTEGLIENKLLKRIKEKTAKLYLFNKNNYKKNKIKRFANFCLKFYRKLSSKRIIST